MPFRLPPLGGCATFSGTPRAGACSGRIVVWRRVCPGPYSVTFDHSVPIMMRDGVTTYADVFRPRVDGAVPALLQRTPYDKSAPQNRMGILDAIRAAGHGYAIVIQDVRGRFTSEGDFYTFFNEINDGYDSVEWVASQPWCNG